MLLTSTDWFIVVLEGKNVLVPARHLSRDSDRHELREPHEVLDFHLAKLEITIEHTVVESVLKSHRVASCLFNEHNIIDALALRRETSALAATVINLLKHGFILVALNCCLKLIEAVCLV